MKEEQNINGLPKDWKWVKLKDIAESIQYGFTESSSKEKVGPKFLRITDIQDNRVLWNDVPYCKIEEIDKKKYLLKDGDLVFARTGATVGKSFLIKGEIPEAVFASYLIRVRVNKEISEKYLSNFFHSTIYWSQITDGQVGIGQPNVNGTKLGLLDLPLPPKEIQQQIVSKIEELFSELDKGIEELKTAQQQLDVYRQAVLKRAFEKIEEREERSAEECCNHIVDCLHSTAKFSSSGFYCIDTTCIENGKILFDKARYVDDQTYLERISRLKPEQGDILFAREGTVGTTLIVPPNIDLCLGQRMMMFRLKPTIDSKYFMYFFQSTLFKVQYKPLIMGTTAPHLNIRDIRRFKVIVCSLKEQQQIVEEIESRLSVCDKIEETITNSLKQAEALRQSILKKAFEGKLTFETVRND
jgi:type I restriction enzyme, S subunit